MNQITVFFENRGQQLVPPALWQYDYGQTLVIRGLALPLTFEVHFTNNPSGKTTTAIGTTDNGVSSVEIPDAYLLDGSDVFAYIYLHTGADDGETEYKIHIPVRDRAQPTHETPTPVQQSEIEQALAAMDASREAAAASARAAASSEMDAEDAATAAATAKGKAETAQGKAEDAQRGAEAAEADAEAWATGGEGGTPTATNNAKYYSEQAGNSAAAASASAGAADDSAEAAEAWAVGKRDGTDVGSSDPAYHNNAKYYADQASGSASDAAAAKTGAEAAEDNAEAWATGGASGTPTATNNAKYFSEQASGSASAASASAGAADDSAEDAEAWAVGKRDGTDVPSSDPAYQNNAKYYAADAAASAAASAANTSLAAAFSSSTAYAKDDYVLYNGKMYQFTAAHPAGAWIGTDATEVTVGDELDQLKSAITNVENTKAPVIIDSASGAVASFPDGADGMPVKSLIINIDPVQEGSGDPSPDNVRPISGWTGAAISHSGEDTSDPETISVSWQSEAGTVYGGTLDVLTGVLTVDRARVDLGTLGWDYNSTRKWFSSADVVHAISPPATAGTVATVLCEQYRPYSQSALQGNTSIPDGVAVNASGIIIVRDLDYDDKVTFAAAVDGVYLVYPLATPQTYQLTPHEVATLLGTNNIFADTGDTSVSYCADTKLFIEKLTQPTEDDMIANSNITSGKFFMVGNNLFISTAAIAQGAAIVPGTNCTPLSLADALNQLNT